MNARIVLKGPFSSQSTVIGAYSLAVPLPTFQNLAGNRNIRVGVRGAWPAHLPTPGGGSGAVTFSVMDLLRCASRYFFVESWWAGKPDGWVLSLPMADYLDPLSRDLVWKRRNSNVSRWLSEMAGVAVACYLVEGMGACNISLGCGGAVGPDYRCDIYTSAGPRQVWFEAKGTTSYPIPAATVGRASAQLSSYKGRLGADGIVFYTFVRNPRCLQPSIVEVEDPEFEQGRSAARFQADIASMAAALSWAGITDLGVPLAMTVLEDREAVREREDDNAPEMSGYTYRDTEEALYSLREFHGSHRADITLLRSVSEGPWGVEFTLGEVQGTQLRASFRPDNVFRLMGMLESRTDKQFWHEVDHFHLESVRVPQDCRGEGGVSVGPDGSALRFISS